MTNILITGAASYIGTSFEKWLHHRSNNDQVDKISLRNETWKDYSFEPYDVLFHTAALVHRKEQEIHRYDEVNRDLTIEVARKAKAAGVKHFIFLSTMGVYGMETGVITADTQPDPQTPYAKSKYEAELQLNKMHGDGFIVTILRPPLVYGRDCPGNYRRLADLALRLPFFPEVNNQRSMLYIDNLSAFIKVTIDNELSGLYFPQNKEFVNTTELMTSIASAHGKQMKTTKLFNWIVQIGQKQSQTFRKVFGSLTYDKKMPGGPEAEIDGNEMHEHYVCFEKSVKLTEQQDRS